MDSPLLVILRNLSYFAAIALNQLEVDLGRVSRCTSMRLFALYQDVEGEVASWIDLWPGRKAVCETWQRIQCSSLLH